MLQLRRKSTAGLGTGSSKHAAAHQEAWRALSSSCGLPGRGKRRSFEAVLPPATPCGEQDQDFNEIRSTAHGEPSVSCQSSIGICSTRTINGIRISLQPRMVFEGSGILARSLTAGPLLASIESQHPLDTKRLITASPRLPCSLSVLQIASKRATPLRRMRLLEPGREDAPPKSPKTSLYLKFVLYDPVELLCHPSKPAPACLVQAPQVQHMAHTGHCPQVHHPAARQLSL